MLHASTLHTLQAMVDICFVSFLYPDNQLVASSHGGESYYSSPPVLLIHGEKSVDWLGSKRPHQGCLCIDTYKLNSFLAHELSLRFVDGDQDLRMRAADVLYRRPKA